MRPIPGLKPSCKFILQSVLVLFSFSIFSTAQAQDCDRECLEGFVDQLMSAYEIRDASGLPMADNYRYTENGQDMAMDDGLWQNFVSHNSYELAVSDPVAGQVVFLTVVKENEDDVIAHFRLKIEDHKIAEIEALLARNNNFAALENLQTPRPIFLRNEPVETRSSRKALMEAADAYFTGLDTENSGANVPFDEDCQRQENGMILANSPDPEAGEMQKLGCKAQFDTGFSTIVTDVRERRYMVIDEERGLSYAIVFFDHNGTPKTMGGVGGVTREVSATYRRPSTIMIGELFKLVDGNIRQIEAIIVSVPYGMPSGWDGEDLISMGQL